MIKIEDIETLVSLHQSRNIAEAAKLLGLTQPALSAKLNRIQMRSRHPLFVFEGKRKRLDPSLGALLNDGQNVFKEILEKWSNLERLRSADHQRPLKFVGRLNLLRERLLQIQHDRYNHFS